MNLFSKYLHICSWVISIPPINNSLKVHSSLEAGAGLFTPSCLEWPGQAKALNYCIDPYITPSLKAKWQVPPGKAFLGKVAAWEACSSPLQVRRRDSLLPFCCAWQTHTGPRSARVMGWKRSAYACRKVTWLEGCSQRCPESTRQPAEPAGEKMPRRGLLSSQTWRAVTGWWELTSMKTTAKIRFWSQVPARSLANLILSDQKTQYSWASVFPLYYIYWVSNNNNKLVPGILDASLKELKKLRLHSKSLLAV